MPSLHLTSRRNQRDFVWPTAALLADRTEPAWSEIEAAIAAAATVAGPVYLTGGEPTLRRDLFAIIAKLVQVFPERDLVLVSNGRLFFYEKICDALEAVGTDRLTVEVVIASTRRDVHDAFVGVAESFDQASKGIQHLIARGRRTRVRVLVGRHNRDHLHEIAAWIPDRFAGVDRVVWDIATLAGRDGGDQGLRPDEIASYLESAINLLQARTTRVSVVGMPTCAVTERYRDLLDCTLVGTFRDSCAPCDARAQCCGLLGKLAADPAFQIHPVSSTTDGDVGAAYDQYLTDLLRHYVPEQARGANLVLDAMCGRRLRNLPVLRRFFPAASSVHATDIDVDEGITGPPGTTVFRSDVSQPAPMSPRYDFIALFKPADNTPGLLRQAVATLVASLGNGGHFLIVLAEHTDVDTVLAELGRLNLSVLTSEPNALRASLEPEHKWVIVCRSGGYGHA